MANTNISQYFIIRFNDLGNEKLMSIKELMKKALRETMTCTELMEVLGADKFDLDKPDVDRFDDWFVSRIEPQLERAWCEMEVSINLYEGKKIYEND